MLVFVRAGEPEETTGRLYPAASVKNPLYSHEMGFVSSLGNLVEVQSLNILVYLDLQLLVHL